MLDSGEWLSPGVEFDSGPALVGRRVFVQGHGDGTVLSFEQALVGASAHTLRFGSDTTRVKLRRKGNAETPWVVYATPPSVTAMDEQQLRSAQEADVRAHTTTAYLRMRSLEELW